MNNSITLNHNPSERAMTMISKTKFFSESQFCRVFNISAQFPFTTYEMNLEFYHEKLNAQIAKQCIIWDLWKKKSRKSLKYAWN